MQFGTVVKTSIASFFGKSPLKFSPQSLSAKIFVWGALPFALLLLTLSMATLHPCLYTSYLPLLGGVSSLLILCWRTKGLILSYIMVGLVVLWSYPKLAPDLRLWEMGILFTFALCEYIVLLTIEEIATLVEEPTSHHKQQQDQMERQIATLSESEKLWQQKYEDEVKILHESRHTSCETQENLERQLTLLDTEVQLLTGQKKQLLADAIKGQAPSPQTTLPVEDTSLHSHILESQQAILRAQQPTLIEEKKETITQPAVEETSLHSIILDYQESILRAQQPSLDKQSNDTELVQQLKRELAQKEGLYHQLRGQFDEKASILADARKELFKLQGVVEGHEKQTQLTPYDEADIEEYAQTITTLNAKQVQLEEEIEQLELLVSTSFKSE